MYGYVRPVKSELRVREYELYRSAYCGLCHTLRSRFGPPLRFLVNYDLAFLAMALSNGGSPEKMRCPVHPVRSISVMTGSAALADAADYSVILTWWKLSDDAADERGPRAAASAAGQRLLEGAYRAAVAGSPQFDEAVRRQMAALAALERAKCDSLDRTADCFAQILTAAAIKTVDPSRKRVLEELFYHVGRTVYLLDAVDDLAEDFLNGRYNPLRYRFELKEGRLDESQQREVRGTLDISRQSAERALSLRAADDWQSILENIVSLGLPMVTDLVFEGKWNRKQSDKLTAEMEDKKQ